MGLESMVSVPGLLLPAVQHWPHATVQPQEATPEGLGSGLLSL